MSGDPRFKARLAEGGGVWQTEFLLSQSGRNRWRGFPLRKPVTCMGVRFFYFSLFALPFSPNRSRERQVSEQCIIVAPRA